MPFFKESIELACRLPTYLDDIHSIEWDIGITPEGPIFIEGNDDWEGSIPMALDINFQEKLLKMYPTKIE